MMDDLTPLLSRLPEPPPASTLTASVMARVHREVERKLEAEQTSGAAIASRAGRLRELQPWLWSCGGVALVLLAFVNGWLSSGSLPSLTSARIGVGHQGLMPVGPGVSVLLALGLIVYLAGLFAPLRTGQRD
jgi:hypothetical protein